jgi:hypothetical protein
MRSFPLSVAGIFAVVLAAHVASAEDTPDADRAAALFAEARRLMAAGDYTAACPKLAESQALEPAADTAFDLGICYQKASQAAFKAAHDLAPPSEQGGRVYPSSLALAPVVEAPPPGRTQRVVGLAMGGTGLAGLVAGVITFAAAKSASDGLESNCSSGRCTPPSASQRADAQALSTASNVSLVAGAVALATGAVVFFTAPRSTATQGTVLGLGPATVGAGLSFAGRF